MKLRHVLCAIFLLVLGACASSGHQHSTSVHVGVGYHDPWYHGGYYHGNYPPAVVVPPPSPGRPPINERPPVAKPPIAKPPVSRPPSIPSRPRPMPMRGGRR